MTEIAVRRVVLASTMVVVAATTGTMAAEPNPTAVHAAIVDDVRCDLNGDGYDDLPVGVAFESWGGVGDPGGRIFQSGVVNVIFGSASGLTADGNEVWHQGSAGIGGGPEPGDLFGWALVCGDFDGNGDADLAVGVPNESIDATWRAGAVHVLPGSAAGPTATGSQVWHQGSVGIGGTPEGSDRFGEDLAAGDFDGDGYDDLAIGARGESIDDVGGAGAVHILPGSATGPTATGSQVWHQLSPGIGGGPEWADYLGDTLETGDFDGDGYDDLAIGALNETIAGTGQVGAVHVLSGSSEGLTSDGAQVWHRALTGLADTGSAGHFSWAMASGDLDGDGFDELAVTADGVVVVLVGTAAGLTADGHQVWTPSSPGIDPASLASWSGFGRSVAIGDVDDDGFGDLSIGLPDATVVAEGWTAPHAGAVLTLYGSASGLVIDGHQVWSQGSPGIEGFHEHSDRFGFQLAVGDFDGDRADDLAIGVREEDIQNVTNGGAVNLIYGGPTGLNATGNQIWGQDSPGIEGEPEQGDAFGRSLDGSSSDAAALP